MYNGIGATTTQVLTQAYQTGGDAGLLAAKQALAQQRAAATPTTTTVAPSSPQPQAVPGGILVSTAPDSPASQGTTPLPQNYPSQPVTPPAPLVTDTVPSPVQAAQMMAQPVTVPGAALPDGTLTAPTTVSAAGLDPKLLLYVLGGALVLSFLSRPKRRR